MCWNKTDTKDTESSPSLDNNMRTYTAPVPPTTTLIRIEKLEDLSCTGTNIRSNTQCSQQRARCSEVYYALASVINDLHKGDTKLLYFSSSTSCYHTLFYMSSITNIWLSYARICFNNCFSPVAQMLTFFPLISFIAACESAVALLFDAVMHLGCKPYLDSQRESCVCQYEVKREL